MSPRSPSHKTGFSRRPVAGIGALRLAGRERGRNGDRHGNRDGDERGILCWMFHPGFPLLVDGRTPPPPGSTLASTTQPHARHCVPPIGRVQVRLKKPLIRFESDLLFRAAAFCNALLYASMLDVFEFTFMPQLEHLQTKTPCLDCFTFKVFLLQFGQYKWLIINARLLPVGA